MEMTPELSALAANIATIAMGLLVIVIAFIFLNTTIKRIISGIIKAPTLKRWKSIATKAQRNVRLLIVLLATLSVLTVIGFGLYWMYLGRYLPEYTMGLIRGIPARFWIDTGLAIAKVAGLLVAAAILLRYLHRLVGFLCARMKEFEGLRANDASIEKLFGSLGFTINTGTWLAVFALAAAWLGLPAVLYSGLLLALRIFLIVAVGVLIWRAVGALIDSGDALSEKYVAKTKFTSAYKRLRPLIHCSGAVSNT